MDDEKKVVDPTTSMLSEFAKLIQEGKKAKQEAEEKKKQTFFEKYKIENTELNPFSFISELAKLKHEAETPEEIIEEVSQEIAEETLTPTEPIVEEKKTASELLSELASLIQQGKEANKEVFEEQEEHLEPFVAEMVQEIVELQQEEIKEEQKPVDLISKTVESISKVAENNRVNEVTNLFSTPEPDKTSPNFKAIQAKLKSLEQWVSKISTAGPGSGSYWLNDLGDTDKVSLQNATDGQVLKFSADIGKWTAQDEGGSGAVGTLQQVTTQGNTTTLGITAAAYRLNLTSAITVTTGQMAWNPDDLTVDVGMANGVTLQLGQEQYIKVKAAEAISDGDTVMFAGADGNHILAARCNTAVAGFKPEWFIGVATQNLSRNGFGYVTTFGKVHDLNTLAWREGDILYVDANNVGALTNTAPTMPRQQITVAAVTKRAGGDGHLMVRPSFESQLMLDTHQLTDAAYNQANVATTLAQSAYNYANTINASTLSGTTLNSAIQSSNLTSLGALTQLVVNATNSGVAASITTSTYDGTKQWIFYGVSNPLIPNSHWIQFPDSTKQYTAFDGTAIDQPARNTANNASSNTIVIQGIDATQNTRLNALETVNTNQNTSITIIQGVDTTQNTNITAADGKAQAAFDKANTAITTLGGSITGRLNVTFTPATTVNTAMTIVAANTVGGTGYADFFKLTNSSAGATSPNKYIRIGPTGTLEVINSAYNSVPMYMTDNGDLFLSGNLTMSGIQAGYSANRPGFRVYGANTAVGLSTTQNGTGQLNYNNWAIDYNQGSFLNHATGTFTAPIAGLYQICLNTRNAGNAAYSQLACCKNGASQVLVMIEFAGNSTMNHTGGSTVAKLAAGDTLNIRVLAGTITFDGNDNWSVTYLG